MASGMVTLLVLVLFFGFRNYGSCSKVLASKEEDLELKRQLQILNEHPVKTIRNPEGDIIDCIDINKQPAFDHPLLKNHKVQLRPTSFSAGIQDSAPVIHDPIHESLSKREACPDGTVPIQRTTEDDLVRAKNISNQLFLNNGCHNPLPPNIHQVFVKLWYIPRVRYFGVWGFGSVFQPALFSPDQSSSGNVFVKRGPPKEINAINAGWMVSPSISGDNLTRLYTYWTVNNGDIGCFNLLCAGFVQVDRTVYPGIRLAPVSIVGGQTYETKFTIYQDPHSQNWWFTLSDKNITVGYWPKEIFTHLRNGADEVGWGGTAMSGNTLSPPVGSGRYPDGNMSHAAYFRSLHYMRAWLKELTPTPTDPVREYIGPSGCYGIQNDKDTGSAYWGYRFTYGGPGGDCGH